jgi:hypothetical protein
VVVEETDHHLGPSFCVKRLGCDSIYGPFGVAFAVNNTYFPETRAYHALFSARIQAINWIACFFSISLAYVLYRYRKENK